MEGITTTASVRTEREDRICRAFYNTFTATYARDSVSDRAVRYARSRENIAYDRTDDADEAARVYARAYWAYLQVAIAEEKS